MRIGAADGEGPDVFAQIVDVELDPMGRVWVADGQQNEIRVFDSAGAHVRTIGRKGGGPREFNGIAGMAWAPDGRLWVLDGGNARFAVYDTSGQFLATHPRQSILTSTPWPGRFDARGRLYDVSGEIEPDGSIATAITRSQPGEEAQDTFKVPDFTPELFTITRGDSRNRITTEVNVPFTGNQAWGVDPEGYVWVANTARYRIERHAFRGGVERVLERAHNPVPVTRQERDRMLENYRGFIRQGGKIDLARIPETHPALNGFLFDDAGHLWVSPTTNDQQGRVLDVFRLDGSYLGRVGFPAPAVGAARAIRGNRLVAVTRNDLDVPTVVVMGIEKPER